MNKRISAAILLATLIMLSGDAVASISSEIVLKVKKSEITTATIKIKPPLAQKENIILLPLPFFGTIEENSSVNVALLKRKTYMVAVIFLKPRASQVEFDINIEPLNTSVDTLNVRQIPQGKNLVFPMVPHQEMSDFDFIKQKGIGEILYKFDVVSAYFETDITILEQSKETKYFGSSTHTMNINKTGDFYEIIYNPTPSSIELVIGTLLSRLVIIALALFLTFASPDIIPESAYSKVMASVILIVVALLSIRWFLALRYRDQINTAISDTLAAIVYALGVGLITYFRKYHKKTYGAQPDASPDS